MDKQERGKIRIKEILGPTSDQVIEKLSAISKDFANYVVEFAYGDIYSRPGLTDKVREVAAVACLIGQGNTGMPLKSHLRGLLNVGHTKHEVLELLIYLTPYIGFPAIVDAMITADGLFKEIETNDGK